jgi:hypothetical protein
VGAEVLGYLPGYLEEEQYDGDRFLLVGLLWPWDAGATVAAVAVYAAVVAVVLGRRPAAPEAFAALLGGLLLVATPVQPWYAVTLLAVAAVAGRAVWTAVLVAGYPYFFAVILDHPHSVAIGRWGYGLAAVIVVLGLSRVPTVRRWRRGRAPRRRWAAAGP